MAKPIVRVVVEHVPNAAVDLLLEGLILHGAAILFQTTDILTGTRMGEIKTESGVMKYVYVGDTLTVGVVESYGHFPKFMLVGGIRQTIQEAVERVEKEGKRNAKG